MEKQKKVLTGVLMLSAFIFIVSAMSLYAQENIQSGNSCTCSFPIPLCIPLVASIGLFIGSAIAYSFIPKNRLGLEAIKKFLAKEEGLVVSSLLESGGKSTQAKLSQQTGLGKVKTFRILEKLQERGIITKENKGKIRIVLLSDEIASCI
ncbi:MAG: hypothetical protein JW727_00905 [Candidatus Aenigmarchaeota archaeon]|nr:hypothetical protein [Candidatus Aenigmarchaeota archaeon]